MAQREEPPAPPRRDSEPEPWSSKLLGGGHVAPRYPYLKNHGEEPGGLQTPSGTQEADTA